MAGEFLLIQGDLGSKREVLIVAEACQLSAYEVIGRLVVFWDWATTETEDGFLPAMNVRMLSGICPDNVQLMCPPPPDGQCTSFWRALEHAGWIVVEKGGIRIPNWDRWLSRTAQAKHLDRVRKRASRTDSVREVSGKRPGNVRRKPDRDGDGDDGSSSSSARAREHVTLPASGPAVVTAGGARGDGEAGGAAAAPSAKPTGKLDGQLLEEIALNWGLGFTKVRDALERLGTARADWDAWRTYERMHGTRLAIMNFQRYRSPTEIPQPKAGAGNARGARTSAYNEPDKFKGV